MFIRILNKEKIGGSRSYRRIINRARFKKKKEGGGASVCSGEVQRIKNIRRHRERIFIHVIVLEDQVLRWRADPLSLKNNNNKKLDGPKCV